MSEKFKFWSSFVFSLFTVIGLVAGMILPATSVQAATGFSISGRNLLDANGNNFIMRGISHPHVWYPNETSSFANIKAAGANTVRVVLSGGRWGANSAADVANVIQLCKTNKLICVLENHDTTGFGEDGAATTLAQAVSYWQSIQSVLAGQEAYVIINIGNEPYGNTNSSNWIEATRGAIIAMRNAGFDHTLMVDAGNWGQDWEFRMRDNATSLFNSDVDRNTIFSIHMYGVFDTSSEIQNYISTFVTSGLPLVIGEFGHNHSDGNPDEDTIMAQAQSNGIGYIGWSWSGNGGGVEYLDMVTAFNPNQRTSWGTRIITGNNGLQQTSVEASVYSAGGTNTPTHTLTRTSTPTFTPTLTPTQPLGNNTGWVSPGNQALQSGGDGNGYQTSPTNAFVDGGGVAADTNSGNGTSTSCTSTAKDRHAYFNYPLSIPSGSTITGIEVRTDAFVDNTANAPHFCVEISWNNGTTWTAIKTGPNLLTTERTDILGGTSDTWGRAWNTSELTSTNFRVRVVNVSSNTSRDFSLDWLPVRVSYTTGGGTNTPTATPSRTNTPTPTNTACAAATAEPMQVEPVTSPTNQASQVITVRIGNGDSVTVTHEFGTTTATGNFSSTNPALVTIPLQANATHHLTVSAHVRAVTGPGGCTYGNYTLTTTVDRFGAPLTIVQTSGPITPTITPTFTPTFTPTVTYTTGPSTLKVQYRAADTNAGDNQIKPHFNIVNPGGSAVPLSELKIRYWYTREGTTGQNFWCDWSAITGSCSNLTGTFVQLSPARTGADFYLEVGFTAAAGPIAAGGQSGEIQARFAKADWSNYTETGDYSFDPSKTQFSDWNRVTLYRNGILIWGVEP